MKRPAFVHNANRRIIALRMALIRNFAFERPLGIIQYPLPMRALRLPAKIRGTTLADEIPILGIGLRLVPAPCIGMVTQENFWPREK